MADEARPDSNEATAWWGAGTAIGIGIGVALGVAMNNIGAGIALGVGIGMSFAVAFTEAAKRRNTKPDDEGEAG